MNAMPAVKLKVEERKSETRKLKGKAGKNKRGVRLYLAKPSPKVDELSDTERQHLVITYRIKARKLARSILRRWHSHMEMNEVDSIVDLSLCEAVRRFNPNKGASFITFLFYHLRGNLIKAVAAAATANALPVTSFEIGEAYADEGDGRSVTAMDVADALSGEDYMGPDEVLFKKELLSLSLKACSGLDELEKQIIERIYLCEEQVLDIARELGYSRCHVSRVKKKALKSLYANLSNSLHGDDLELLQGELAEDESEALVRTRKRAKRRRISATPDLNAKRHLSLAVATA